jgi:hypothetical protein
VINVLKKWIEHNFSDIKKYPDLYQKFSNFVQLIVSSNNNSKWGKVLQEMMKEAEKNEGVIPRRKSVIDPSLCPRPLLPRDVRCILTK